MRIYGLIVLIAGIVFELLFVMASLGGAKVTPIAFSVAAFLIVTGYGIRRSGTTLHAIAKPVKLEPAASLNQKARLAPGVHMRKDLAELFAKYEPLGQWKAGELLLRPADALRFADEIQALGGVGIVGVDIWHYVDGNVCEDPGCLDSSMVPDDDEGLDFSIRAAKEFISRRLPPRIALVSFVLCGNDTD